MQRSLPNSRSAILEAAREELAAHGYDGMTMRQVANRAGVDPRLVRYYFPSKRELVWACLDARFNAEALRAEVLAGDEDSVGHRLVRRVLDVWHEQQVTCRALLAAVMAAEEDVGLVLAMFAAVVEPAVEKFATDRHPVRCSLVCAQLLGLWLTVGVAGSVDPRRSVEQLATAVGDAVHRLITAPLPSS